MSERDDSGACSAFPAQPTYEIPAGVVIVHDQPGLTKRELFAAMMLAGMASPAEPWLLRNNASYAVEAADALLAALKETP